MKISNWLFMLGILLLLLGCGANSIGTGVGNPPGTGKVAQAVAALFNSSENANVSVLVRSVRFQSGDCVGTPATCMCEEVIGGYNQSERIDQFPYGSAGNYGSVNDFVSLTTGDFCAMESGGANSGSGPDGYGLFATFEIIVDVDANCSDGQTFSLLAGSTGVFRSTDATESEPAYGPQIYGHFLIDADGESFEVDCAIYLPQDDDVILAADCSDASGETIEQETSGTCEIPGED